MKRNVLFAVVFAPLLAGALLLGNASAASLQDPKQGPKHDPEKAKVRQEKVERFLENHPKLRAKLDEFKSLTPEQKKERIQKLREEHPGKAKRIHRFLMRHPGLRAAMRQKAQGLEPKTGR